MNTTYAHATVFDVETAADEANCDTCHKRITENVVEVEYRSVWTNRRIAKIDWLCEDCAKGLELVYR